MGLGFFLNQKDNVMKKFLLILTTLLPLTATAQLNGAGYYRVKNYKTQRYITITDDVIGEVDMTTFEPDMTNITTLKGFDNVKSDPASIIYFEPVDSKWNMIAQGVNVYEVAEKRSYITVTKNSSGYYTFSATASGITLKLSDSKNSGNEGYVTTKNTGEYTWWDIKPIDTADNYLGLQPTVKANDGYYGTLYAALPFKVHSSDIKIYYVDGVKSGIFQLKEITSEVIPASTPLVFKCSSDDPSKNIIVPVLANSDVPTDNYLGGTLFDKKFPKHNAYKTYDASTMRVLGVNNKGELTFTTAKSSELTDEKFIPKNTCWLNVPNGLSGDFKLVNRDAYTGIQTIEATPKKNAVKGTFTLSGVQVDDSKALRPGIYIRNGEKVVIK